MSKAVEGAAMLAGAVGMGALAMLDPALLASPLFDKVWVSLIVGGISMEAGAIADALTQNRGIGITTRQPASFRQVIYGEQRVPGVIVYSSTTGSSYDQYNFVIVIAGHEIDSILGLYLDGRKVYFEGSGGGWAAGPGGVYFGGTANSTSYTGPGGQQYNFGGLVYCEARYGNQEEGDVISGLTANDPIWAASSSGSPWLGGCAYVYLKVEYDAAMFPSLPEVRFTVRGKNNIYDPRTSTTGFTNNWALIVADVLTDTTFGLGDVGSVNTDQLIAAANVCDEQVELGAFAVGAASGGIDSIGVSSGIAYGGIPSANITISGDGSGATATPIITQVTQQGGTAVWACTGVTITDAGTGYTTATAAFSDLSGWTTDPTVGTVIVSTGQASTETEARYCCNWHYDTGTSPGDVLQTMMPGAQGRLSRIGGEWYIWPAYWQGPSFTWSESDLTAELQWSPYRSFRDLINCVNGTYIAPNFPWNISGNLYDSNGFFDGTIQNNFNFAFQPTNYPQYAEDVLHGYPENAFLIEDGNVTLPLELTQSTVLSVTQAQRCAKIALTRNRQQGSGTLQMNLNTWQMQPLDVMQFTFAPNGWSDKLLEITSTSFSIEPAKDDDSGPTVKLTFGIQETDPSVYEWSMSEELSVYDVPTDPGVSPYSVGEPTDVTAVSNSSTALTGADGVVTPRILVSWTAPADATVTQIQSQFQAVGAMTWQAGPTVPVSSTSAYVSGVVSGTSYNVEVSSLDAAGSSSDWVEVTDVAVSAPNSTQATYTNTPAISLAEPNGTTITMASVSVSFGGNTPVTYASRSFTLAPVDLPTWYYVTIADPTQQGESGSPMLTATCQTSDALVGVTGNTYMGAVLFVPQAVIDIIGSGNVRVLAGGWPAPQTIQIGA
jgi:hypothetical protein